MTTKSAIHGFVFRHHVNLICKTIWYRSTLWFHWWVILQPKKRPIKDKFKTYIKWVFRFFVRKDFKTWSLIFDPYISFWNIISEIVCVCVSDLYCNILEFGTWKSMLGRISNCYRMASKAQYWNGAWEHSLITGSRWIWKLILHPYIK